MASMTTQGRPLRAIATGQRGIFSRRQANAGGVTDAMLRSRIQSGHLNKLGVRTFASPFQPSSPLGQLQALMLDVGDPVWASGTTAAALHGFDGYVLKPPFQLVTSRGRNVRRLGHVIRTSGDLPLIDCCSVQGLAATTPTRTLIDLVRSDPSGPITNAVDSAIRNLGTTEDFLHRRISALRSSGRYGIPRLLAIIEGQEATRGGQSWLERRFLEIVADARLPRADTQVVMSRARDKLVRVDCYFRDRGVVVELLGYRWHRTQLQMVRDAERMNRLALQDIRMVQFTYSHVAADAIYILATLRECGIVAVPSAV